MALACGFQTVGKRSEPGLDPPEEVAETGPTILSTSQSLLHFGFLWRMDMPQSGEAPFGRNTSGRQIPSCYCQSTTMTVTPIPSILVLHE